jgi:hypothetical protein
MSFNIDGLNYCALAHRIVREASCASCGASRGARCLSRPTVQNPLGRALAPSESHRARIEAWHEANPV